MAIVSGLLAFAVLLLWLNLASVAAQRDVARAEVAQLKAEIAATKSEALRKALAIELQHAQDMQELGDKLKKEMDDAEAKHAGVVAGLQSGAVRLRKEWQGCEARLGSLPEAAETASSVDDLADLRATGAADIVRVGAECDARIRAWQSYARAVTGE